MRMDYEQIARETGVSPEEVRKVAKCLKRREIPYLRVDSYGREYTAYNKFWAVPDEYRPRINVGAGDTRADAVIDALCNGFRA